MNPQPPEYVGSIFAALFIIGTLFYALIAFLDDKEIKINDNFILGYFEDQPHNTTVNVVTTQSSIKDFESTQLYSDCIEALYALGMKKSEAKKRAKAVFSVAVPSSIQEFLMIALRNTI